MSDIYKTEEIILTSGNRFKVTFSYDDYQAPWEVSDAHGEVSEWTKRDKKPGEVILCKERTTQRYYDMQGAIQKAKAEGWSCDNVLPTDTHGQKAAKAAQADFEYLKAWCSVDWWYCCLHVAMLDINGEELPGYDEYLGGVEDGYSKKCHGYALECAQDIAADIERRYLSDLNTALISELHRVHNHALFEVGII